jgi:restriction system protein
MCEVYVMPVPSFDLFIDPLLRVLAAANGPIRAADAHEAVAAALKLSEVDKMARLPSATQTLYANRNGWAHDRLKRAGFSESLERGVWKITDSGLALAREHAAGLPREVVTRLAYLRPDIEATNNSLTQGHSDTDSGLGLASPEDRIASALSEIRGSVAQELQSLIRHESPAFFESLVLDLLHKMGYGQSREELQAVGGPGDGGIDGIISLDKLGLQKVYVQAKRWQGVVGSKEVRGFIGALSIQGADKGVMLTTSTFTDEARAAVAKFKTGSVVLIDGDRLAGLMIDHGVGVTRKPMEIPKVNGDYFSG